MTTIRLLILILLSVCITVPATILADPVIAIDLDEIETMLNTGDIEEHFFNIFNEGDEELRFTINHEIVAEPGRDLANRSARKINGKDRVGPRRDDFGDRIAEYELDGVGWTGLAYDGELMWGISAEQGMIALDPVEGEVVEIINRNGFHMGLAYDGESFWTGTLVDRDEVAFLQRIDREGNINQTLEVPGMWISGVAYDGENLWYYSFNGDPDGRIEMIIRQITTDGEILREINCNNIFEGFFLSLAYVPEHEDGNLWVINWETRTLNQLDVSRDDPQIIQQTGIIGNQGDGDGTFGLEHDGENMWYCNGGRIWYVIDDGLGENSWLSSEPDEGEIEAGGDMDIIVTIDATGLIEGLYEAEIHILSNDPENDDTVINVRMDITGVPIIEAIWEEEVGYPDVINWNEAYIDLFTGEAYEIDVTIANIGTAQLMVEDIFSELEIFTADQDNFELNPGDEIALNFILETENEGVFESEMVVVWNSPDGEDYSIPVIARTSMPPVIEANQNAIEAQLEVGDSEEHVLNLLNAGNSNLRFMIESEIISEPGMDFNERSFIRSVNNQSGPRRDDLGEIVGQHNVGEWGWTGLAYDGELMWGISPEAGMMAFDPMTSEIVENIELEREYYGMAFDGESFWVGSEGGDDNWMARLLRLDRNGQIEQTIVVQGWMATGVTFDGENLWYYSIGEEDGDRNIVIRQITVEGELIREINCNNIFEGNPLSLAYVSEHEDGNLWVIDWETRVLYQFDVSVDDPQILQQTQINGANIFGLEHDGENMWYCTINDIWYVIEDGVRERQWLTYDPKEGEVEPDGDFDIIVTFDATEFIEGAYEADLHVLSNDPNTPDLIVNVLMEIGPSSAPGETSVPISYSLSSAYPNPFNSSTRFDFDLPKSGFVSISIFDVSGRLIALIRDNQFEAGHHQIIWNADGFANGVYVVQLHVNDFHANTKVVLVK